jgi:hypothetical protein
MTATQKREKEGEEGRERPGEEREGSAHYPKNWKERVNQVMSEQEERDRSEKRRDRSAGGREGDKQTPENETSAQRDIRTERDSGDERKQCVAQKGIGRTHSHRATILHVRNGKMRAHGGWAMGSSEEGGRRKRREKQAGQAVE